MSTVRRLRSTTPSPSQTAVGSLSRANRVGPCSHLHPPSVCAGRQRHDPSHRHWSRLPSRTLARIAGFCHSRRQTACSTPSQSDPTGCRWRRSDPTPSPSEASTQFTRREGQCRLIPVISGSVSTVAFPLDDVTVNRHRRRRLAVQDNRVGAASAFIHRQRPSRKRHDPSRRHQSPSPKRSAASSVAIATILTACSSLSPSDQIGLSMASSRLPTPLPFAPCPSSFVVKVRRRRARLSRSRCPTVPPPPSPIRRRLAVQDHRVGPAPAFSHRQRGSRQASRPSRRRSSPSPSRLAASSWCHSRRPTACSITTAVRSDALSISSSRPDTVTVCAVVPVLSS